MLPERLVRRWGIGLLRQRGQCIDFMWLSIAPGSSPLLCSGLWLTFFWFQWRWCPSVGIATHPAILRALSTGTRLVTARSWSLNDNKDTWCMYDDVIKWKHFPRYWPFVREIRQSPMNSPQKGQWRGALMFSLICIGTNDWVNNRDAGDLRHNHAHYDVTVIHVQMIDFWKRNLVTLTKIISGAGHWRNFVKMCWFTARKC